MDFMMSKKKGKNYKKKRSDSSLKVVYISSPMKVKTSAAKFRTIVQKLTGRDSDISTYMLDGNRTTAAATATPDFEILPETFIGSDQSNSSGDNIDHRFPLMDINPPSRDSPTSSDSLLEQTTTTTTTSSSFSYGDLFMNSHQIGEEHYFHHQGLFPSNLFGDSYRLDMDVLGSYDAL